MMFLVLALYYNGRLLNLNKTLSIINQSINHVLQIV